MIRVIFSGGMSACRRTFTVYPARRTRFTACRTGRMSRPSRPNLSTWMIASSPISRACRPNRAKASAPSSLAPITAGAHAYSAAWSSQARMAGPHASGSPIGSPLAMLTLPTTR